jgi:osmotically inducible protein OsmC
MKQHLQKNLTGLNFTYQSLINHPSPGDEAPSDIGPNNLSMINRNATAVWNGSGKEGSGHLTTQSTVLNQTQYSFNSRFAEGIGTNPEELVAAAHAGCFTMKLSFVLGAAGFTPGEINTKCVITLDPAAGAVTASHLTVSAKVPGCSPEQFEAAVVEAEANCPISKLLKATITHEAVLA